MLSSRGALWCGVVGRSAVIAPALQSRQASRHPGIRAFGRSGFTGSTMAGSLVAVVVVVPVAGRSGCRVTRRSIAAMQHDRGGGGRRSDVKVAGASSPHKKPN